MICLVSFCFDVLEHTRSHLFCSNRHGRGTIHWSKMDLSGATLPLTAINWYQLLSKGWELVKNSLVHAQMMSYLISCRSYAKTHSCSEGMKVMKPIMSRPAVLPLPFPVTELSIFSAPSFTLVPEPWVKELVFRCLTCDWADTSLNFVINDCVNFSDEVWSLY